MKISHWRRLHCLADQNVTCDVIEGKTIPLSGRSIKRIGGIKDICRQMATWNYKMCASLLFRDKIMIVHVIIYFVNGSGTHFRHVSFCIGRQSSHYLLLCKYLKQNTKDRIQINFLWVPNEEEWMIWNNNIIRIFLRSLTMWYGFVRVSFLAVRNNREKSLDSPRYIADVYAESMKKNYTFLKDSIGIRYVWYIISINIIELRKNI